MITEHASQTRSRQAVFSVVPGTGANVALPRTRYNVFALMNAFISSDKCIYLQQWMCLWLLKQGVNKSILTCKHVCPYCTGLLLEIDALSLEINRHL